MEREGKIMDIMFWIIVAFMFALASMAIADDKPTGFILGLLFGPIGLVVSAIMKGKG